MTDLTARVRAWASEAKDAAAVLAAVDTRAKNAALGAIAGVLRERATALVAENARDVEAAEARGVSAALLDRLRLSEARVEAMAAGVEEVIALPDPVGGIDGLARRPNGLLVGRMRVPLGVIAMIYEARPNVAIEASALTLKSGNAILLKGGSEARHSNRALALVLRDALSRAGLPAGAVTLIDETDRAVVEVLVTQDDLVDVVIPRGGEGLIRAVVEKARVPVLQHYKGVCHAFVDHGADLAQAATIVVNAKAQRPGVCNALETLLVHRAEADAFLPLVAARLADRGVVLRGCPETCARVAAEPATDDDWAAEYLDLILAVRVVDDLDAAMAHIRRWGSRHTEAILTRDHANAMRFLREVDASCVVVNASTRFNDGNQLGLGAEIGISTTKLHAYGPMGLEELTTRKFVVFGEGQVRG
jgi:glutamate-5-semialdehyde dehydrogenase